PSVVARAGLVGGRPRGSVGGTVAWLGAWKSALARSGSGALPVPAGRVGAPTPSSATGGPGPAPRILGILGDGSPVRQEQRAERVDHDGSLVGRRTACLQAPDHRLDRSWYRAVGEPRGVQGD